MAASIGVGIEEISISETKEISELAAEEFKALKKSKAFYKELLVGRAAQIMKKLGHVTDTDGHQLANLLVEGKPDALVATNDFCGDPSTKKELHKELCYLFNAEHRTPPYNFLFLYAPGDTTYAPVWDPNISDGYAYTYLSVEDDERKRLQEIQNFCKAVFGETFLEYNQEKKVHSIVKVLDAEQVKQAIWDFFMNKSHGIRASGAVHAIIVFLGHGSDKGELCMHSKNNISLDAFNKHVDTCFQHSKGYEDFRHLPAKVEIIYGQCYAHLYDKSLVASAEIKIRHFTDGNSRSTRSKWDDNKTYYIVELEPVAQSLLMKMYFCNKLKERVTKPSDVSQEQLKQRGNGAQTDRPIPCSRYPITRKAVTVCVPHKF